MWNLMREPKPLCAGKCIGLAAIGALSVSRFFYQPCLQRAETIMIQEDIKIGEQIIVAGKKPGFIYFVLNGRADVHIENVSANIVQHCLCWLPVLFPAVDCSCHLNM